MRALALGFVLVACVILPAPAAVVLLYAGQAPGAPPAPRPAADAWQTFDGTFSVTGRRDTVPQENGSLAATVYLSGSLVISHGTGLRRGFRIEAVGFEDGAGAGMARAVWTDDQGDRVFSRMVGAPLQTGRRSMATITGGTGRYQGISGSYTFTWQYVMPGEQGVIQARTLALSGRYRREAPK